MNRYIQVLWIFLLFCSAVYGQDGFNPENPPEPNAPDNTNNGLIILSRIGDKGETINFPVYLLNKDLIVYSLVFDIVFPVDVLVGYENPVLSDRKNGHEVSVSRTDNRYHFEINNGSNQAFFDTEGILLTFSITLPHTWNAGESYPVTVENVVLGTSSGPVSSSAKNGMLSIYDHSIYVDFTSTKYLNRVLFTNASSENATDFLWDFGDGNTSNEREPLHVYENSGSYDVRLEASNNYTSKSMTENIGIDLKSAWQIFGTFSLNKHRKELTNFTSPDEFFRLLSQSTITSDIYLNVESGETFEIPYSTLSDYISALNGKFNSRNATLTFKKEGTSSVPIISITGTPGNLSDDLLKFFEHWAFNDVDLLLFGAKIDAREMSELYKKESRSLCSGDETEALELTRIGNDLNYTWTFTNSQQNITGYQSSGAGNIPAMTLYNASSKRDTLSCHISVRLGAIELLSKEYSLEVVPILSGIIGNLYPSGNVTVNGTSAEFSWSAVEDALYDIYLWQEDSDMPEKPSVSGLTLFRRTINNLEREKTYNWKVVARNSCSFIESDIASFNVDMLPDLHVTDITFSDAYAGNKLNVAWTVRNDGRGNTGVAGWTDYVWLIPDINAGTANATLLKSTANISALQPDESYENTVEVTLPERISGNYYLLVTCDMYSVSEIRWSQSGGLIPDPYAPDITGNPYPYLYATTISGYNKMEEAGESPTYSDNFFYKKIDIELPPLPDLQVSSIIPPGNFYSGQKVTVSAQITNKGEANIVNKSWTDAIYLTFKNDPEGAFDNAVYLGSMAKSGDLNQNESYIVVFNVSVPSEYHGTVYFAVCTDINDRIYEHANISNNTSISDEVNMILTPPADLSPVSLNIPEVLSTAAAFDLSVEIRNQGGGSPDVNHWTDKIYLSTDDSGINESAIQLFSKNRSGSLAPETTYLLNATIDLNKIDEGEYYVYAKTDANDEVFELDTKKNNVLRSQNKVSVLNPDLSVEWTMLPDKIYSGNTQAVSWTIKNAGGEIREKSIVDSIFFSKNQDGSESIPLAASSHQFSLRDGEERTFYENLIIPYDSKLSGNYYLFVKVDANNTLREKDETNNISLSGEVEYSFEPKPDIMLADILVPSRIAPGETASVSFQVKNAGHADLIEQDYSFHVFLYNRKLEESSKIECIIESQTGNFRTISAGGSEEITQEIRIPENAQGGNQYLYIIVDQDGLLDEVTTENNSISCPIFVAGNLSDLVIIDHTIPSETASGVEFDLEWTVMNQGMLAASRFSDAVYISDEPGLNSIFERLYVVNIPEIAATESYTQKTKLTVPDKWHGDNYMIIASDYLDQMAESDEDNNKVVIPVSVSLSPLPDLQIKEVSLSGECISGQTLKIKYEVINNGYRATSQDKWSDSFYFSASTDFNKQRDKLLGSKIHIGVLEVGESYKDSIEVNIPSNFSGNYTLFTYTDSGDAVYELSNESNNIDALPVSVLQPLPADLLVEKVTAPSVIVAGEIIEISYDIKNQGEFPASGVLKDAIYISKDTQWDSGDTMVGTVSGIVSLESGNATSRTAAGRISNVPVGEYYIIVRTNLTNSINEDTLENNYASAGSKTDIDFNELILESSLPAGNSDYFKLEAQSSMIGETLSVNLKNEDENGSAGLYIAYEEVPTVARYDYSSSRFWQEEQQILIPALQEGTYYILTKNNTTGLSDSNAFSLAGSEPGNSEQNFQLSAKILQFEISNIHANQGGLGGSVTSDITGAKLDTIMDFYLKNQDQRFPAEAIYFQNQTYSIVSFNLDSTLLKLGTYDVVAGLSGGQTTELKNAYTVVDGVSVGLTTKIIMPSSVRLSTTIPFSVEYSNTGNMDVAVWGLTLSSENGHPIGFTTKDLDGNYTELFIPLYEEGESTKPMVIPPGTKGTKTLFVKANSVQTIELILKVE